MHYGSMLLLCVYRVLLPVSCLLHDSFDRGSIEPINDRHTTRVVVTQNCTRACTASLQVAQIPCDLGYENPNNKERGGNTAAL